MITKPMLIALIALTALTARLYNTTQQDITNSAQCNTNYGQPHCARCFQTNSEIAPLFQAQPLCYQCIPGNYYWKQGKCTLLANNRDIPGWGRSCVECGSGNYWSNISSACKSCNYEAAKCTNRKECCNDTVDFGCTETFTLDTVTKKCVCSKGDYFKLYNKCYCVGQDDVYIVINDQTNAISCTKCTNRCNLGCEKFKCLEGTFLDGCECKSVHYTCKNATNNTEDSCTACKNPYEFVETNDGKRVCMCPCCSQEINKTCVNISVIDDYKNISCNGSNSSQMYNCTHKDKKGNCIDDHKHYDKEDDDGKEHEKDGKDDKEPHKDDKKYVNEEHNKDEEGHGKGNMMHGNKPERDDKKSKEKNKSGDNMEYDRGDNEYQNNDKENGKDSKDKEDAKKDENNHQDDKEHINDGAKKDKDENKNDNKNKENKGDTNNHIDTKPPQKEMPVTNYQANDQHETENPGKDNKGKENDIQNKSSKEKQGSGKQPPKNKQSEEESQANLKDSRQGNINVVQLDDSSRKNAADVKDSDALLKSINNARASANITKNKSNTENLLRQLSSNDTGNIENDEKSMKILKK